MSVPVMMGREVVHGIPPEIKAAIGCADNIVQAAQITFTNKGAARLSCEVIPTAENTAVGQMLNSFDLILTPKKKDGE